MLRVGLTGGIGAGKSTVARRLADLGAVVVDADRLAREVVEPGTGGLAAVVEAFGDGILAPDGSLDRAALGAQVFSDEEARRTLGGILHPRIAALTAERMAALPEDAIVVHDVPLLVENRMGAQYHVVLVVHAPVEERVRRLVTDRGMPEADARARVAAQADDEARRAAADVWLDNSGGVEELEREVTRVWGVRLRPFERNLRERRFLPPPEAGVREPDPQWPHEAARLIARVARAVGHAALRIDHVGSTAVAGLAAMDVVDLQLVVPDLAVADGLQPRLEGAGFIRSDGPGRDGGGDPASRKHTYLGVDPGRRAVLDVRPTADPVWREVLLFRDWLRADDRERESYAVVKRTCARSASTVAQYRWHRSRWIGEATLRAEAWAVATGWSPNPTHPTDHGPEPG